MANNTHRFHGSRGPTPARTRSSATRLARAAGAFAYVRTGGALLLLLAGLWAAGLTPLDAFGPPPGAEAGSADKAAAPRPPQGNDGECGPPHHDDQHRDVRSRFVCDEPARSPDALRRPARRRHERRAKRVLGAKARSGAAIEQRRAPTARGLRACASSDVTGGASGAQQAQHHSHRLRQRISARLCRQRLSDLPPRPSSRFATMLENVKAEPKPNGAASLSPATGARRRVVTPLGDGTPRVVLSFPNVRSQAPATCSWAAVLCTWRHGACRHATVDLLRPATYRVTGRRGLRSSRKTRSRSTTADRRIRGVIDDRALTRGGLAAAPGRATARGHSARARRAGTVCAGTAERRASVAAADARRPRAQRRGLPDIR